MISFDWYSLLQINSVHLEPKSTPSNSYESPGVNDHRRRRYSSPGEERVYREMMEQQVRENELRQHWKQVYFFFKQLCILRVHLDEQ